MKVTGETITDEQIRELKHDVLGRGLSGRELLYRACCVALYDSSTAFEPKPSQQQLSRARARCADAWNARHENVLLHDVTADTITDAQILDSGASAEDIERASQRTDRYWTRFQRNMRRHARAHYAKAWHLRHGDKP